MASVLLEALSAKPGASKVTLLDGVTVTGYKLMPGVDWGNSIWETFFSGPRGTQGARSAGAEPSNRPISLPLAIRGDTTDEMHSLLSVLWGLDEDFRRFGGAITWRPEGATYKQYFDVLSCSARIANYDWPYHNKHYVVAELAPVCAPYLRGDPYDIFDGFDTDTAADYTVDAAGGGALVKGGQLVPTATGTMRWRHTGRGYTYGDVEATLKIQTGSTVASYDACLFINADTAGAETFLAAQLLGGNLRVVKYVAGAITSLASTAYSLSANTTYWLRVRREGRRVVASVYILEPTPFATPAATVSYTLSIVDNWQFPEGHSGLRVVVVSTAERYDDLSVRPFSYVTTIGPAGERYIVPPDERSLRPGIVGDAPALADVEVTESLGGSIPLWALLSWWQRPSVWNYVWNGDFETDVDGWSVAAVSGVLANAGTSIARNTTAARNKYGGANAQIVCPATANSGATSKINRRFYQGRRYTALVWVSSAAGTTLARGRLGVSGDIVSSTATALSTTRALHVFTWTPSADRDGAYVAFEITAATATTFNIDGVVVFEARGTPLTNSIDSSQTTLVVDQVPDDWPATPFLATFPDEGIPANTEIVGVDAIDPATRTLTIVRGLEETAGVAHAPALTIAPLPEFRSHYEGKGAQPPVGVIDAESADTGNLFTWAITGSATKRLGNYLYATGIAAAGSAAADWLVDPHLLVPDDYTQGEIAVEVWGRVVLHAGLTAPTAILSAAAETATVSSGVMSSLFGAIRYAEEYGPSGKPLVKPSSGEAVRFVRLGTIRFPVDRANPLRWRLQLRITYTGATAATLGLDYLVLVPSNARALSPTGKTNDANFPKFFSSTSQTTKTVRSDLSALTANPPGAGQADHGLGGSLIELPYGSSDWLLKLSNLVPDDPTSNTTTEDFEDTGQAAVHLAVTPRFRTARSS